MTDAAPAAMYSRRQDFRARFLAKLRSGGIRQIYFAFSDPLGGRCASALCSNVAQEMRGDNDEPGFFHDADVVDYDPYEWRNLQVNLQHWNDQLRMTFPQIAGRFEREYPE